MAVAWERRNGLVILQEACFDPQFGIETHVWLQPGRLLTSPDRLRRFRT
jgi:hypothetical protein